MSTRSYLTAAVLGSLLVTAPSLSAQDAEAQRAGAKQTGWELLVTSGAVIPTGAQREAIKQGKLTAAQVSYVIRPSLAVTTTVGWARTRDIATVGDPRLNVFTYDVGAEVRAPRWIAGKSVSLSSFAGAGVGGRSYDYRGLHADATHNAGVYGSVGGELGVRRVRLRVEARDYLTGFAPLNGEGPTRTGNDVVVMAGLRFVRR